MFHADSVGLQRIAEVVGQLHEQQGALVKPSELLRKLAAEGRGFADRAAPTL